MLNIETPEKAAQKIAEKKENEALEDIREKLYITLAIVENINTILESIVNGKTPGEPA